MSIDTLLARLKSEQTLTQCNADEHSGNALGGRAITRINGECNTFENECYTKVAREPAPTQAVTLVADVTPKKEIGNFQNHFRDSEKLPGRPDEKSAIHSELVTERAAIREYDGGQPREQAAQDAAQEVGPCFLCGGGRFWVSTFGVIVCERCHPPATPKIVARLIALDAITTRR